MLYIQHFQICSVKITKGEIKMMEKENERLKKLRNEFDYIKIYDPKGHISSNTSYHLNIGEFIDTDGVVFQDKDGSLKAKFDTYVILHTVANEYVLFIDSYNITNEKVDVILERLRFLKDREDEIRHGQAVLRWM